MSASIDKLMRRLARLERDVRTQSSVPRLGNSSIDSGTLLVNDPLTGEPLVAIGQQEDGSTTSQDIGGPAPTQPSTPLIAQVAGGVTITWDGSDFEGNPVPWDVTLGHISVRMSAVPSDELPEGEAPTEVARLQASTSGQYGGAVTLAQPAEVTTYVTLVAVRRSGVESDPSVEVDATGGDYVSLVDLDPLNTALDGLQADLDVAEAALASAEATLGNLVTVTIPGLTDDLADLNTELDAHFPITSTDISDDAITTPKIAANAVTANEIAANTITANEIAADAVTASEIAANTITAAEIAANTITANEIAANTITAAEIAANTITANEIAADAVTANEIAANTITANEIAADTITANEIAADAITANEIAANAITAAELSATAIDGLTITGSVFRTAASGQRVMINESGSNDLRFYSGNAEETSTGSLHIDDIVTVGVEDLLGVTLESPWVLDDVTMLQRVALLQMAVIKDQTTGSVSSRAFFDVDVMEFNGGVDIDGPVVITDTLGVLNGINNIGGFNGADGLNLQNGFGGPTVFSVDGPTGNTFADGTLEVDGLASLDGGVKVGGGTTITQVRIGTVSTTTNASGNVTVTHGGSTAPTVVILQSRTGNHIMYVTSKGATTFTMLSRLADTNGTVVSASTAFDWIAIW